MFGVALIVFGMLALVAGVALFVVGISVGTEPPGHATGPAFGILIAGFGLAVGVAGVLGLRAGRRIYDAVERNNAKAG
jgi:hypothetical protein